MAQNDSGTPDHVGIIMDGNGRWARKNGLPRSSGHNKGLETARNIVAHASKSGISTLSLYVFSTENWRRTEEEIAFLMNLIHMHIRKQYDFYKEHKLRVTHSGNINKLPDAVQKEISLVERDTANFTGMRVNLLINYGGRDEIVRSVRRYLQTGKGEIQEKDISENLDSSDITELDLLIRTGGEYRLSNFLIWQAAYAELIFSELYWPDWTTKHFDDALKQYKIRQRRFGGM